MSLVQNKKAYFDFEILTEYEAGLELLGFEVKSIKKGMVSLKGSYISIEKGEAFLKNAHITPYQEKNTPENYDPKRERKLLLSKKEIKELTRTEKQKRLTVVPISMYNKNGKIKLKIATARGKRKYDKRERIREREEKRKMDRTFKYNH